jgi:hypothetical protein
MASSKAITQSLTLSVKEGMNLGISSQSQGAQEFSNLTKIIKAQKGVLVQYWVVSHFPLY